ALLRASPESGVVEVDDVLIGYRHGFHDAKEPRGALVRRGLRRVRERLDVRGGAAVDVVDAADTDDTSAFSDKVRVGSESVLAVENHRRRGPRVGRNSLGKYEALLG